eukprot:504054_1
MTALNNLINLINRKNIIGFFIWLIGWCIVSYLSQFGSIHLYISISSFSCLIFNYIGRKQSEPSGIHSRYHYATIQSSPLINESTINCNKDILACPCSARIKIILDKFNTISNELNMNIKSNYKTERLFIEMPFNNGYNNTQLLNDFHHIKYHHNVDQNDCAFAQIYGYITNGMDQLCNHAQCKHFKRHFKDRSSLNYRLNNNNNGEAYTKRLISRIHVYFIHSYDMDRLTLDEINQINDLLKPDDDEKYQMTD